jgi:hypothetical protein
LLARPFTALFIIFTIAKDKFAQAVALELVDMETVAELFNEPVSNITTV